VRALHHYSEQEGPHRELAGRVYRDLRTNIVNNVMKEYYRTGFIWEQYNDRTGEGQGCKPFTGWSALTVLMMGETY
jgi:mannosyl-oligosaccharide glucosidase